MARKPIRSDLAWSSTDRIVVRGMDLPREILGKLNLGDMAFLELTGRTPQARESKLFNAMTRGTRIAIDGVRTTSSWGCTGMSHQFSNS